ncbi:hypothetical protein [Pseudomonas saponiphila]|uniref:hypothetical protein n=1 Tax=Pseudomonas saponiphila TaxID=556534 RepID=UPI00115FF1A9|nr:hypothetical protein [Pseudomonas saponiphila]
MKPGHERPVDRMAARVVGAGINYEFKVSEGAVNSFLPLPTRPVSRAETHQACFTDLTTTKFGRLTVIGISAEVNARWVVRCVCGTYGLRTAKAIKNAAPDACCHQCHLLALAKRKDLARRTGRVVPVEEFLK